MADSPKTDKSPEKAASAATSDTKACVELAGRALCGLLSNPSLCPRGEPIDHDRMAELAVKCGGAVADKLAGR